MLHSLQVALRSFNRSRTKAEMPKIYIINITTSGPDNTNRNATDIARETFSTINSDKDSAQGKIY